MAEKVRVYWEEVDQRGNRSGELLRARVPGGWLVRIVEPVTHDMTNFGRGLESCWDRRDALAFVIGVADGSGWK